MGDPIPVKAPYNYVSAPHEDRALALPASSLVAVPQDRRGALASLFRDLVGDVSHAVHASAVEAIKAIPVQNASTYDNRPGFKVIAEVVRIDQKQGPCLKKEKTHYRNEYVTVRLLSIQGLTSECASSKLAPDGTTVLSCVYHARAVKDGPPLPVSLSLEHEYAKVKVFAFFSPGQAPPPTGAPGTILCFSKVRPSAYIESRSVPLKALFFLMSEGYGLHPSDGCPTIPEWLLRDVMSAESGELAAKRDAAILSAMRMYNALNPDAPCDDPFKFVSDLRPRQPWGPDGPTIAIPNAAAKSEGEHGAGAGSSDLQYDAQFAGGGLACVRNVSLASALWECSQSAVRVMPRTAKLAKMYKDGFVAVNGAQSVMFEPGNVAPARRFITLSDGVRADQTYHLKPATATRPAELSAVSTYAVSTHKTESEIKPQDAQAYFRPCFGVCFVQTEMVVVKAKDGSSTSKINVCIGLAETLPKSALMLPISSELNADLWCKQPFAREYNAHWQGSFVFDPNSLDDIPASKELLEQVSKKTVEGIVAQVGNRILVEHYNVIGSIFPVFTDTAATVLSLCGNQTVSEEELGLIPVNVFPAKGSGAVEHQCNGVVHRLSRANTDFTCPVVAVYFHVDETVAYDPNAPPPMIAYRGKQAIEKIVALAAAGRAMSPRALFVFNLPQTDVVLYRLGLGPDPSLEETTGTKSSASQDPVYQMIDDVLAIEDAPAAMAPAEMLALPAPEPTPERDAASAAATTASPMETSGPVAPSGKRTREEADLDDGTDKARKPKRAKVAQVVPTAETSGVETIE